MRVVAVFAAVSAAMFVALAALLAPVVSLMFDDDGSGGRDEDTRSLISTLGTTSIDF